MEHDNSRWVTAAQQQAQKPVAGHGWRRWLWQATRINVGPSPDELHDSALYGRVRRPAPDGHQIGVIGLKGGVGRTTVTAALGSAFSEIRRDRILAIDVDPNAGNLADRTARHSPATVEHLLHDANVVRYHDIRAYTQMTGAGLEVLAAPDYGGARREFGAEDWRAITRIVGPYYNLILADVGKGLHNPATRAVLSTISSAVIVCSATADGARQAAVTMNWLGQNGYHHLARRSCVVINHLVPVKPQIDVTDLGRQYEQFVGHGRVVLIPWDAHIAAGNEIHMDLVSRRFRRAITELAAALSDDFSTLAGPVAAAPTAPPQRQPARYADATAVAGAADHGIDASEAVTLYLKHSPGKNDAEFDAHYGPDRAETARTMVRSLLHEAMRVEPDWNRMTLGQAGDYVKAVMHQRHPELSDQALTAIGNSYTYSMR
ncbi:MinD-like ATPase involved in chromosome partitioning or flagellar assembly [Mycobacterium sp. OAS707]|uniref:AAA family ATPase n=1 Tax=Mycobacterium sp. OAS707 TaxID=2663822 RepID=UPI00178B2F75|nr:MinD-like ATPase involved in chromosome partitioning or flagellar assembly [Mycobacterium sp. OAS707]